MEVVWTYAANFRLLVIVTSLLIAKLYF